MPSPSMINSSKTFQHDDIHLWLAEHKHRIELIQAVHKDNTIDIEEKYITATVETSVYSSGRYLVGSCDCLMDYKIGEKWYALIIEMKPILTSASGVIGQLNPYKDHIADLYWNKRTKQYNAEINMAILTFDTNTKYDAIYERTGIVLYRISKQQTQII